MGTQIEPAGLAEEAIAVRGLGRGATSRCLLGREPVGPKSSPAVGTHGGRDRATR